MSTDVIPPNPDDGRRGRPPKCTPAVILHAVDLLLDGNYRTDVARAIGVSYTAFRRWMNTGRRYPDGIYGQFRQAVVVAESTFKTRAVGTVTAAGSEDPRLLLEFLGRKYPRQFGAYRGELGALKKLIREQAEAIAQMERQVQELLGGAADSIPA